MRLHLLLFLLFSSFSVFLAGQTTVTVTIQLDGYAYDNGWFIYDAEGEIVAGHSRGYYTGQNNQLVSESVSLPNGFYSFRIYENFGNGLIGRTPLGYFRVEVDGDEVLFDDSNWGKEFVEPFVIGTPDPRGDTENDFTLFIQLDAYAYEVSWTVKDMSGNTLFSRPYQSYSGKNDRPVAEFFTLPDGQYVLTVTETYGNGLVARTPPGYYFLRNGIGQQVAYDVGNFGYNSTTVFTVGTPLAISDLTGVVTRINPDYENCTPSDTDEFIENIEIELERSAGNESDVTDVNGAFSFVDIPYDEVSMTPSLEDNLSGAAAVRNGLDVGDMIVLQRHILEIGKLNCPITRIAADYNIDGVIDTLDVQGIGNAILENSEYTPPSEVWRFIPTAIAFPTVAHPDMQFVGNFWSSVYPSETEIGRETYYPFDATLSYNGVTYSYNGIDSWMNKLTDWRFDPDFCAQSNFNFWLVKAGDANGDATTNFNTPAGNLTGGGTGAGEASFRSVERKAVQPEPSKNKSKGTEQSQKALSLLEITISAKAPYPIQGYQVGMKLLPRLQFQEVELIREGGLVQNITRNFNLAPEETSQGNLRMLWVGGDNGSDLSLDVSEWTELFKVKVSASLNPLELLNLENLLSDIVLDGDLLATEIFGEGRRITIESDLRIEVSLLGL